MGFFRKLLRRSLYFNAAAAFSTLLLLATLILWLVSRDRRAFARYCAANGDIYILDGDGGRAGVLFAPEGDNTYGWQFGAVESLRIDWSYFTLDIPDRDRTGIEHFPSFLGICWYRFESETGLLGSEGMYIPFSYLALLFSILPLLAFRSIRRRQKLARVGRCGKCGYDLRAHAPGKRCPECGTVVGGK